MEACPRVRIPGLLQRLTVALCHNTTVRHDKLLDGAGAARPALHEGSMVMQLCGLMVAWGARQEIQETVSHKLSFLPYNFCAPVEVASMARAMPAIP